MLIAKTLKNYGRAGVVLPDGTLFGEGVKTRIKEFLLRECNLHTIVRLPNGVFNPYTGIKTNLLFFEKGKPTQTVWYWEHRYPEGVKNYNKTRPIRIEEFESLKAWWHNRVETEQAWQIPIETIEANGFNLDIKNPNMEDAIHASPEELLVKYKTVLSDLKAKQEDLKSALASVLRQF